MSQILWMTESVAENSAFELAAFPTDLGWFGLVAWAGQLCGVKIGHLTRKDVLASVERDFSLQQPPRLRDWHPELTMRMQAFARGEPVEFNDIVITYSRKLPPFREAVIRATRCLSYGHTVSYQELAALAGSPRAARAVGNTMATNRFPIIVPCHRVLATGGRLGGFTAPGGLDLKQRLLDLEQRHSRL